VNIKSIGILAILGASIMWAIEPVFAKLSYRTSNFLQTSVMRAVFVTITALVYILVTNKSKLKINKTQLPPLVYIAVAGTLFADLMYFFALTKIPVINAVLIGHMQPIFIILIGFLVLQEEKLTKFDYVGIFFMIIAGVFVTARTLENLSSLKIGTFEDVLVLAATIAWATTALAMKKYLRGMNAGVITFYRFLIASIVLGGYVLVFSTPAIKNLYQVSVGIVVGVGTILYYEGLKRIKTAQVSALELSTPFFAALLGFFVLKELVTVMQFLGILLLLLGIYFLSRKEEMYF
jgi:drug/metabolite transporter (DMT)-like permease